MVRFPSNSSQTIFETTVGFLGAKGLQLWSDFLHIHVKHHSSNGWISQVKKGLQLWPDFLQCFDLSDKKGLKLWSDLP